MMDDAWVKSRKRWVELLREIRKSEVAHRCLTAVLTCVMAALTAASLWRFGLTPEVLFPATMTLTTILWWHIAKKGVERTEAEIERETLWLKIDEREQN